MINWSQEIVSDVARRRCVLVLGSGISKWSKSKDGRSPETWKSFLEKATERLTGNKKHIKKLINDGDFLTACELLKMRMGTDGFNTLLIAEFLTPGYLPSPIHDTIFQLDSRIVATPNFDKIYETHANHRASGSIRIKHQYDSDIADAVRRVERLVLKIHGTIDTPTKMVFTRAEYAKARTQYRDFYAMLDALALTHRFIFLGCGVNDPDIRLLLEDSFFRHSSSRPHLFVLPKKSLHADVLAVVKATMNVDVAEYDASSNHAQLKTSLDELVLLVEAERLALSTNLNW